MSGTTAHGLPYPTGTDKVVNGDDAIKALADAIDAWLFGGAGGPPNGPGWWQTATGVTVCTDSTLANQAGGTIATARYAKIGKTVFYQGTANITASITNVAISLPNALAGVPSWRSGNCGTFIATGSSPPSPQAGVGFMHANLDRLLLVNYATGYLSVGSGTALRWSVFYDVV